MGDKSNIFQIPLERLDMVGRIEGDILYGVCSNSKNVYLLTNIVISNNIVIGYLEFATKFCSVEDFKHKTIFEMNEYARNFYFAEVE